MACSPRSPQPAAFPQRADLAIRIGQLSDSSLIARRIATCRTVVCAAPAYLKTLGTPLTVAELAKHNCLGYTLSRRLSVDRWVFGKDGKIVVPVSGNLRANNGSALRAAAIAGQGIIYQPTSSLPTICGPAH